ncbi:MAG: class I SAM-dependent methyltransferase [Planctomycetia bacterium]|nr:class I SAM-dependent methyltransferase [Planctomycetia bacterium]
MSSDAAAEGPASSTPRVYWNSSTLILPLGGGLVRLYSVWERRNVVVTRAAIELIDLAQGGIETAELQAAYERLGTTLRACDATDFTLWECAYANPDNFNTAIGDADLLHLPWADFLELLTESGMLSTVWPPTFDGRKRSFGDQYRGSFHEQLATESLFRRTPLEQWWTAQKFSDDLRSVRPTPYHYVQETFLDSYFPNLAGSSVLEIGCGTGYWSGKAVAHAARVVGVDINRDYIEAARRLWPAAEHPNLRFEVLDAAQFSQQAHLPFSEPFDYVLMVDMFLFLVGSRVAPPLWDQRYQIMDGIKRVLSDRGVLLILDPHPCWLTPWFGSPELPFGVFTEYRHRTMKVVPTLEEMSSFFFDCGLRIRRILEPPVDPGYQGVDRRAAAFMNQAPPWWFFEVERARV